MPRDIDFSVVFATEANAIEFAKAFASSRHRQHHPMPRSILPCGRCRAPGLKPLAPDLVKSWAS
jgi:hypothetical protein